MSDEQRRKMGYLCMTKGGKAGVAYVKHIERERERKCRLYMTYGFLIKGNPHRYVYCAELRCRGKRPAGGASGYPALRSGNVWPSTEAVLNRVWNANWMGITRPVKVRKNYETADLSRPVVVWLYTA